MALAIDASSPAIATQTNNTIATVATASFTPPAGSVLLVLWDCDALATPSAPSITDSLGTPLTYTRTDWQSVADSPGAHGQAAAWVAPVGSSAAMTVTVTSGSASGERISALKVVVWTGADTVTMFGAHGKSGSLSASSIAQSYTAQATGGWGNTAVCDFDQLGAQTAGTGCTLYGSANVGTAITYGFNKRTSADDVNGNSNTLNTTIPGTSTNLNWVYVEILPAATTSAAQGSQSTSRHPGRGPGAPRFWQSPRPTDLFSASLTDAGSGSDAVTVSATVPLSDSGTAAEDSGVVSATIPLTDTGTAADAVTVADVTVGAVTPGPRHPGRGPTAARFFQTPRSTDVNPPTQVALTDTGTASDAVAVSATVPLTDSASADDSSFAVAATIPLTDAGTGVDAAAVTATVPLTDVASGTDTAALIATITLADVAAVDDALTVQVTGSPAAGTTATAWHPGRGPTSARFFQTPRSTAIKVCDCITHRPSTGMTARPGTGTTARPNTGITVRPCTC